MRQRKVHIGVQAPEALALALKDVARMRGTSLSVEVRRALWAHAERMRDEVEAHADTERERTHV